MINFVVTKFYMDSIISLPSLINTLIVSEKNEYSEIVKRIKIPKEDFLEFSSWNTKKYTRNCLFRNDDFELLLLCWEPNQKTSFHDHSNQECWLYLVQGEMIEQRCLFNENKQIIEEKMNEEGSYHINDAIGFHSLQNTSNSQKSLTLHLYAKPIDKCVCYDEKLKCFKEVELSYTKTFNEVFTKLCN